jgi:hypothetical protein
METSSLLDRLTIVDSVVGIAAVRGEGDAGRVLVIEQHKSYYEEGRPTVSPQEIEKVLKDSIGMSGSERRFLTQHFFAEK